jgi:hypothetical protein
VRENVDVQVSSGLSDAYEDYNCFCEVVFRHVESFKMEQRAAIKFWVKLKKTATETFEMSKSAYAAERLSRTGVSEWHERVREVRQSLQDDERKGRPSTSRTDESTEVIQKCLAEVEL